MNLRVSLSGTRLFRKTAFHFPLQPSVIWTSVVKLIFRSSTLSPANDHYLRSSTVSSNAVGNGSVPGWAGSETRVQSYGNPVPDHWSDNLALFTFPGREYLDERLHAQPFNKVTYSGPGLSGLLEPDDR